MLSAHNLTCVRNDQTLFSELSFCLEPGKILHVTGPNGVGKSSLLNILTGMFLPQEGRVCWNNTPIQANPDYLPQLAYIGHKVGVKSHLTVLENLKLAATLNDQKVCESDLEAALQGFNVADLKHTLCEKLSAGQRQRVALSRLLVTKALLWVLDEPFTAMDQKGVVIFHQLLLEHITRGGLIVLTSHQPIQIENVIIQKIDLT